jgi:hypothetical protein
MRSRTQTVNRLTEESDERLRELRRADEVLSVYLATISWTAPAWTAVVPWWPYTVVAGQFVSLTVRRERRHR